MWNRPTSHRRFFSPAPVQGSTDNYLVIIRYCGLCCSEPFCLNTGGVCRALLFNFVGTSCVFCHRFLLLQDAFYQPGVLYQLEMHFITPRCVLPSWGMFYPVLDQDTFSHLRVRFTLLLDQDVLTTPEYVCVCVCMFEYVLLSPRSRCVLLQVQQGFTSPLWFTTSRCVLLPQDVF